MSAVENLSAVAPEPSTRQPGCRPGGPSGQRRRVRRTQHGVFRTWSDSLRSSTETATATCSPSRRPVDRPARTVSPWFSREPCTEGVPTDEDLRGSRDSALARVLPARSPTIVARWIHSASVSTNDSDPARRMTLAGLVSTPASNGRGLSATARLSASTSSTISAWAVGDERRVELDRRCEVN